MSSTRSNSHASIDGHDEPLLPLGAAPSAGLDASWMSLGRRRARPLLTKAIYKRVLAGAVALLFLLAVVVYRNKPVSFSGAIINHHHPHPHKDHAGPHTTQGQGQGQGQVQTQDQQTQDKGQAAAAAAPQGQDQDQPSRTQQEAAAPAAETRQAIVVVLPSAGVDIDRQDEDQDGPGDAASGDGGHGEDGVDQELEAKKQQFQDEIQKKPWLRYTQ